MQKNLTENEPNETLFTDLKLPEQIIDTLNGLGWETPTPIQTATIPVLMEGVDVVGQAQTGTGKTAAFALPALSKIDITHNVPQVLVLTPTRELCVQVAAVFGQMASGMRGIRILPVYGGQGFSDQLYSLKKGVHIVVGTPGRVMDHIRRKTLNLDHLQLVVLDEADEMLNMGFAEDIEWILEQTPTTHQTALFSATMPPAIRRIAGRYLNKPEEITIKNTKATADNTTHRYWVTRNHMKFNALTTILEAEDHDGVLIFAKTKAGTVDLAEYLNECGLQACPLNGDMKQSERERMVERFKAGRLDILVATDVAARGLDVDRISHVINYDPPQDTEGYVHRCGRTGRAGRSGQAIIIATPRERRFLADIERSTRQRLKRYEMPSLESLNRGRIERFKVKLGKALEHQECATFVDIIKEYEEETGTPAVSLAAALARALHGNGQFLLDRMPTAMTPERTHENRPARPGRRDGGARPAVRELEPEMDRYRVECGHVHGVKPGNIVGAIANEAGLQGRDIGYINIYDQFSTVDLPSGMPDTVFDSLKRTKVGNRFLNLTMQTRSNAKPHDTQKERPAERRRNRRNESLNDSRGNARPLKSKARKNVSGPRLRRRA